MSFVGGLRVMHLVRLPLSFIAILQGALLSADLYAAEYSFTYGVTGDYEFNDNVGLNPDNKTEISGGQIATPFTLTSSSERLTASLGGELEFSRYDESGYDSDDQNL